ncbi:hypothetical protein [Bradyrhizobium sp. NP1]|uniref:hypothetical protein n=1 Tax=Bradyrhizobium sp. NP1 TaxID=3049772 RepID=UPI0025A53F7E|nr:hypothetical protein [Bradyrhizobium sp. NP1]WJR78773.1 hypothetical protein QOU61_02890 [Bradyrhizobium sp. NP1]
MVKLSATSNGVPFEFYFRDPVKRSLQDAIANLGPAGMAELEAEIDRQLAEGIAQAEARRPGALALALASLVEGGSSHAYSIHPGMTNGTDLLRERMEARGARYDDGRTAKAVWPEIRDQVLVQVTLYFARIATGERFARRPSAHSARGHRIVEKLWFMLRALDRAAPDPTGYFDRSIYDARPEFRK